MSFISHVRSGRLIPPLVVALILCTTARADLVSKDKMKDCDVHVIGMYSPKDHSQDDRVYVEVKPTGKPMVIVLCGYFGAQWNVNVEPEANVRQIIVTGYYEHSIIGKKNDIPVEILTYFPEADRSKGEYFWAYAWHTKDGRQMRTRINELTGRDVTTFQGEYAGKRFVIDGKRGLIGEDGEPQPAAKTSQPLDTSSESKLIASLTEKGIETKLHRQKLAAKFGSEHPMVKQIDSALALIESELKKLGGKPISDTDAASTQATVDPNASTIEALVRESFKLQTQLQEARIAKAEADLARIKAEFELRMKASEQIIAERIVSLSKNGAKETGTDNKLSASFLAAEGWQAWRSQQWREALGKFHAALEKEPDNGSALNGLGWVHVNTGNYSDAIEVFEKLVKSEPTHPAALNGLGQCFLAQGKLDAAEPYFVKGTESVIETMGESRAVAQGATASWFGLVRTYLAKKKPDQAILWADRYLKHKPEDKMMKPLLDEAKAMKED